MKRKILIIAMLVAIIACFLVISASAESVYVNSKGEQVEAGSTDIAYELEITNPWETGGNCKITYVYLYDEAVTKLVIPEIKLTNSNGEVYDFTTYSYVRLSTGWGNTLSVYALDDKETKTTSLHAQIKELEFHIPVLCDGAGSQGNLANWTGLEKLSFFNKAYETQSKGGFLSGCTSLKEIHFYGANNTLTSNFFPSTMVVGSKIVFHENATGTIRSTAMQNLNGKDITVYLNQAMSPADSSDPRLTWNKNGNGLLKFVLLVNDKSGYTEEQIASYGTTWQAGNNKSANNSTYSMPIMTYCDYYGEHIDLKTVSECLTKCDACKYANAAHDFSVKHAIEYADFTQNGFVTFKCVSCEETYTEETANAQPIFTYTGFSLKADNSGSICIGYAVNDTAKIEYETYNSQITFGVVGYIPKTTESPLTVVDGKASAVTPQYTIQADITSQTFAAFDFVIAGFGTNTDVNLVMCAYVCDGTNVYYLNIDQATNKVAQSTTATTFSYDGLEAYRVANEIA